MIVNVHMLAFVNRKSDGTPQIREVTIPTNDSDIHHTLEQVWLYGQNDFQPRNLPSVSMGDVVELRGKLYLISAIGFKKITEQQYNELLKVPQRELLFHDLILLVDDKTV